MSIEEIGIGFGTAGLGGSVFNSVSLALEAGFRKFDTAEEQDYWYDQAAVGEALSHFFLPELVTQECIVGKEDVTCPSFCTMKGLQISTKIPPWELTSIENIRTRAAKSRETLVGFCDDYELHHSGTGNGSSSKKVDDAKYALDVYYIHAPQCWDGWHTRCNGVSGTLPLREAWLGMEGVVFDQNAKRIGLSNIWPQQLLDIIQFVKERQQQELMSPSNGDDDKNNNGRNRKNPPPRMPDVLQIYADPLHPSDELRTICEEHGIEFVSYSTLGTQHDMRGEGNPVLGNEEIQRMAQKYNRSTAEVVLSWAMHHKNMSVIPRSSKEIHIKELARLMNHDPFLEQVDLDFIDSLSLN
jgi:diketogulonate reductase-like aldo/keto reductase